MVVFRAGVSDGKQIQTRCYSVDQIDLKFGISRLNL